MYQFIQSIARRSALCLAAIAVAACSMSPSAPPVQTAALESRAETALTAGDYRGAAALYRQLAATARGRQQAEHLLAAARALLNVPDYGSAFTVLTQARGAAELNQIAAIEILSARAEVGLARPAEALARLDALAPSNDTALALVAAEARALALFATGRHAEAVTVLVDREIWLDTSADVLANQRLIWNGVASLPSAMPSTRDDIVEGWLALAPLTRLETDPAAFRRALLDWRGLYATHPAAGGILAEIIATHRGAIDFPRTIALLLPLSSNLRAPAEAIRDGFLAARIADSAASQTEVKVYDSAALGSTNAYVAAQADGADFIVGPLLAGEVDQIVPLAGFVPTLALNFSQLEQTVFPSSLYQYALSPEDEARAIAAQAVAQGQLRAIALFASDDRGYRLMNSFTESYEALGGEILATAAYVPESQSANRNAPRNAADLIAGVLNIDRSEQRHRRLQANLNQAVEFESRRRQDVDMIFLQASASLGRLLAPQLRFHQAGDIPTYATSDIHDTARSGRDSDLNGLIFPDLPILLTPDRNAAELAEDFRTYWPDQSAQWIRFQSFGYDAYKLVRPIFSPSLENDWPVAGVTGQLELAGDGRVHRGLPFAQVEGGRPEAIAVAPTVVLMTAPTEVAVEETPLFDLQ